MKYCGFVFVTAHSGSEPDLIYFPFSTNLHLNNLPSLPSLLVTLVDRNVLRIESTWTRRVLQSHRSWPALQQQLYIHFKFGSNRCGKGACITETGRRKDLPDSNGYLHQPRWNDVCFSFIHLHFPPMPGLKALYRQHGPSRKGPNNIPSNIAHCPAICANHHAPCFIPAISTVAGIECRWRS